MSYQLLENVANHLRMAGLLDGLQVQYYKWRDAKVKGQPNFIVFRMAGTGGARNSVVQQPDVRILLVGSPESVKDLNDKADAIFANFAGLTAPEGVLKLEPLATVLGPYEFDNGRCVFEVNVRCFVQDM